MRPLVATLLALLLGGTEASAQTIAIAGGSRDSTAMLLTGIVQRGDYLLLDRDTLLAVDAVVTGDLVVVNARVTLEGRVTGAVATIDSDFFVRPSGSVDGPIIALGRGGAYVSGLAEVGEIRYLNPRVAVELQPGPEAYTLTLRDPPGRRTVRLRGLAGVLLPSYERVNGLSTRGGLEAGFGRDDAPTLQVGGMLAYRAARERVDGAVDALYQPTPRATLEVEAGRSTRTPDGWIRGSLWNSTAALLAGSDARNYFESDEIALTFARTPPPPLTEGQGFVAPRFTARISRDRSLESADPWSLTGDGDDWRPNPPIDAGVLASLVLGTTAGWRGVNSAFSGALATEWAPGGIGDFDFLQLSATATWSMQSLWDHQIQLMSYLLLPLGGKEAPLQRWSTIGGTGTLPTFPRDFMHGDHVLFVHSAYLIPIPSLRLPLLGELSLRVEHLAGAAWRSGDSMPSLEQNLGFGIQLNALDLMFFVDPTESSMRTAFAIGAPLARPRTLPVLGLFQ